MGYIFLFSALLFSAVTAKETLITPCRRDDLKCMEDSSIEFINKIYGGVGEPYNIPPFDPMEVPSLDVPGCCTDPPTSMFHWKNTKIAGMKDIKVKGFRMDEPEKTIYANTTVDLTVTSDLTLEYMNEGKSFTGTITFKPKITARSKYTYDVKNDDEGVQHFYIGPETTECEVSEDPEFVFDEELNKNLLNDPDVKAKMDKYPNELIEKRKQMGCLIGDLAYKKLFESWRKGFSVLTTADLFKQ